VRIVNARSGAVLSEGARLANGFWTRAVGLLGSRSAGEGLVIEPCTSVHTGGMRYPIDALFLSGDDEVLAAYCPLVPWRMTRWVRGARRVVELAEGRAQGTLPGDRLRIDPCV
jgi:uncharacterized membrane protein (UPF0127 family)